MEALSGFATVLSADVFVFILLGVLIGLILGTLPGFDITTAVVLLLPVTYSVTAEQGLSFFTALYNAGVAASITAIIFGIPTTSETVMTAVEGQQFTRRGEAGRALGIAIVASTVAGLVATIALMLITPLLSQAALKFGAPEYFALGVLGLVCVASVAGQDPLKGLVMAIFGVFLSTIGADKTTSVVRYHYDTDILLQGIELAPFFIGIFAAAEIFERAATRNFAIVDTGGLKAIPEFSLPSAREYLALKWTMLRASFLGLWVGILPGTGASTASLLAYSLEVRRAKDPSRIGKGWSDGLAAAEAANNAAAIGAFIPLLSLGIPGSGTTAVLLSAFLIHDLQPGPTLLEKNPSAVYAVFASAAMSVLLILLLCAPISRIFARIVFMPYYVIASAILVLATCGAYGVGGLAQVLIMIGFGVLAVVLKRLDYPVTPVVLGFVLGPIVEVYLRRALLISGDQLWPIVSRPVCAALLALAALMLVWPLMRSFVSRSA